MMVRIIIWIFLSFSILSCNQEKAIELSFLKTEQSQYEEIEIINASMGLDIPQGVAFSNGLLYISDMNNNRIIVSTDSGDFIREIKSTTGDSLLQPTGITVSNDMIYVVSSGNHKIIIYTSSGAYIDSIDILDEYEDPNMVNFKDIASRDSIIYVSTLSNLYSTANLFLIEEDKINRLGKNMNGFLSTYDNDVLFISTFDVKKESLFSDMLIGGSGKHQISVIDSDKISSRYLLPVDYTPFGICVFEDSCFVISGSSLAIDEIDLKEKSLKEIYKNDSLDPWDMQYITADQNGHLYISLSVSNRIVKLVRKGTDE